jgi:glycosyltransferase involved in cell wall biosynthesis
MKKLLTIGMATYDDFDGVFFSIQALRMYQLCGIEDQIEFIVIDNNPTGKHGQAVKEFVEKWVKGRYIAVSDKTGTSVRNEIFNNANGKYTLCMDSHVLFEPNAIKKLLEYYNDNPDTNNLIQGPIWYDDLKNISTQFDPVWRGNMFGIWGNNLSAYERGEPFEIEMMGLGMFSCKTSNWQGFNKNFKGFGGEEGYIHEKFRKSGGKCICIPGMKWNHRFKRPAGIPYPNKIEDRVHNYFVGWLELLGGDADHEFIKSITSFFSTKISSEKILHILEDVKKYES